MNKGIYIFRRQLVNEKSSRNHDVLFRARATAKVKFERVMFNSIKNTVPASAVPSSRPLPAMAYCGPNRYERRPDAARRGAVPSDGVSFWRRGKRDTGIANYRSSTRLPCVSPFSFFDPYKTIVPRCWAPSFTRMLATKMFGFDC